MRKRDGDRKLWLLSICFIGRLKGYTRKEINAENEGNNKAKKVNDVDDDDEWEKEEENEDEAKEDK